VLIILAQASDRNPVRLFLASQAELGFDDRAATDFFKSRAKSILDLLSS